MNGLTPGRPVIGQQPDVMHIVHTADAVDTLRPDPNRQSRTTRGSRLPPRDARGAVPAPASDDESKKAFGVKLSGSTVTVYTGNWYVGNDVYTFPQDDVTLTGATEYVFVKLTKITRVKSFGHQATLPQPDSDDWIYPIAQYAGSGGSYTLTRRYLYGDIRFDTPMAS